MERHPGLQIGFWFFVLVALSWSADAAELQLRSQCECPGAIVLLGDVAVIKGLDADQTARWNRIELFPAPRIGGERMLGLTELKRLLALNDIDVNDVRIKGSQARIRRTEERASRLASYRPAVPTRPLKETVEHAVLQYLQSNADPAEEWQVEVMLGRQAPRTVPVSWELEVQGGKPPWTGNQNFAIQARDTDGSITAIDARIKVTASIQLVVATRELAPGDIVRAVDVEVKAMPDSSVRLNGVDRVADVLGMEVLRKIPAGEIVKSTAVRKPLLVHRREPVVVFSRSGGVQVRTTAIALEDGALDELVQVKSLEMGTEYRARVAGLRQVEVFASGSAVAVPNNSPRALPTATKDGIR